jgi:hypothetical protein
MSIKQGLFFDRSTSKIQLNLNGEHFNVNETTGEVTVIGGGGSEDYSDEIAELNRKMNFFYKEQGSLTGGGNKKKGTTVSVTLTAQVKVNGTAIKPQSLRVAGGGYDQTVTPTGASTTFSITGVTQDTTYSLYVNGSSTASATAKVSFFNPAYYGIVASSFSVNETSIKALTELTNYGTSTYQTNKISGRSGTEKICYAYPKSLGALAKIADVDGGNWIDSFTRSEVTVNGESYYVYLLTNPSALNGLDYAFGADKADNK